MMTLKTLNISITLLTAGGGNRGAVNIGYIYIYIIYCIFLLEYLTMKRYLIMFELLNNSNQITMCIINQSDLLLPITTRN